MLIFCIYSQARCIVIDLYYIKGDLKEYRMVCKFNIILKRNERVNGGKYECKKIYKKMYKFAYF